MASANVWARVWGAEISSVELESPAAQLLTRWWAARFAALKTQPQQCIELGAGMAMSVARQMRSHFSRARIIASDFRQPPETIPSGIEYRPDVPIEQTPFGDGEFDLLTAQFAFEYAQRTAAIDEVRRLVSPQGSVGLIIHHAGGAMAEDIAIRIRCLKIGVALAQTGKASPMEKLKLRRLVRDIDWARRDFGLMLRAPVAADLDDFHAIATSRLQGRQLTAAEQELLSQCEPALRLCHAQLRAGLSDDGIGGLAAEFRSRGFQTAELEALDYGGRPAAWGLWLGK